MKLIQVTVPPIDGTDFVVVWAGRDCVFSDEGRVDDGLFRMKNYSTDEWEDDLDAKFFVAGE